MRRVNPIEARKGQYIDSVKGAESTVKKVCEHLETVMSHVPESQGKELVYTQIPGRRISVWQIFLLRKGSGK